MASPVISGVQVVYPGGLGYKLPGQAATLIVTATDSDAMQIEVEIRVRDSAGNLTSQTVQVIQSDPLTYEASTAAGHTVTPGTASNQFIVV